MREIKFRFGWHILKDIENWDGPREWVFEIYTIDELIGGIGQTESFDCHKTRDEYTGLCDKAGKEIYEGDIVKYADACYPATIVFSDGSFLIKWAEEEMPLRDMDEDIEVIGNIYENPELLEKER